MSERTPEELAAAVLSESLFAIGADWYEARDELAAHLAGALREAGVLTPTDAIDVAHLERQRRWSNATFGPGPRTLGVLDHIRKELVEIEADPAGLEWVDVIILAFDGAWRAGWEPRQIIDAVKAKQAKNEEREWPDWRTMPQDRAIEHVRGEVR